MTKPFSDLTEESSRESFQMGLSIYKELCEKYPEKNIENLDLILNSLCSALVLLIAENIAKDNRTYGVQLVHKILTNNLVSTH